MNAEPSLPLKMCWSICKASEATLVGLLRRMTEAESPSDVPAHNMKSGKSSPTGFERLDYSVKRIPGHNSGGMLHARPAGRRRGQASPVVAWALRYRLAAGNTG